MYENLIKVTQNKTVLYISHRLSSAVLSDRIIVIGGGRVLEQGSHSELMAQGGKYSEIKYKNLNKIPNEIYKKIRFYVPGEPW